MPPCVGAFPRSFEARCQCPAGPSSELDRPWVWSHVRVAFLASCLPRSLGDGNCLVRKGGWSGFGRRLGQVRDGNDIRPVCPACSSQRESSSRQERSSPEAQWLNVAGPIVRQRSTRALFCRRLLILDRTPGSVTECHQLFAPNQSGGIENTLSRSFEGGRTHKAPHVHHFMGRTRPKGVADPLRHARQRCTPCCRPRGRIQVLAKGLAQRPSGRPM